MIQMEAEHYKKFFLDANMSKSGSLTRKEFSDGLRKKGYRGSDSEISKMFEAVDISRDGLISQEEYEAAMGLIPLENLKEAALEGFFRSLDPNGDGKIDQSSLQKYFWSTGRVLSRYEVNRVKKMCESLSVEKNKSEAVVYEKVNGKLYDVHHDNIRPYA